MPARPKDPLVIQAEVECLVWQLEEMLGEARSRTPLDRLIDQATGLQGTKLKEARSIIGMIRRRQKQLEAG